MTTYFFEVPLYISTAVTTLPSRGRSWLPECLSLFILLLLVTVSLCALTDYLCCLPF